MEIRANLSRFEGQNAIGSAELFGGGSSQQPQKASWSSYSEQIPEMADIKDSVIQVQDSRVEK